MTKLPPVLLQHEPGLKVGDQVVLREVNAYGESRGFVEDMEAQITKIFDSTIWLAIRGQPRPIGIGAQGSYSCKIVRAQPRNDHLPKDSDG